MSKLSIATVATTILATAGFNVQDYVKKDLIRNPAIKVNKVEVVEQKELPNHKDWTAYMVLMNLNIKGKSDNYPETILYNKKDDFVVVGTRNLFDYKNHNFVGANIKPSLTDDYYNDAHLIAGKKSAKHKIVAFSDPMCPFCRQNLPKIYADVKAHPDDFALYYYHMPLTRIHPVSEILTRVMEVLQREGKMDEAFKLYKFGENNIGLKDEDKVLKILKDKFNINVTKDQIDKEEIKKAVKDDVYHANKMMVKGTPTIYLDGKYDKNVTSYKKFIK